jgi:hypothetical protein
MDGTREILQYFIQETAVAEVTSVARCRWEVNINAWSEKCGLLLVSAASE